MALQAGVQTSKILILVGAGLTGSVVLRSGKLSDLIAQLQELLQGVNEAEISPSKYDTAAIAAQIRHLTQEIRELALSRPVTIYNGESCSTGSYASYVMPAAALGAMGYFYMWWKGLSFSDVMFVTKKNMAKAVETVSKQLENVHDALASTKRHLAKKLENLEWKVEEQKELSKLIANDVNEVNANLSQIEYDVESILQMVTGLEGKIDLIERKQDVTNSGLWYLCQFVGRLEEGTNSKTFQEVGDKMARHSTLKLEDRSLKGLQFLAEAKEKIVIEEKELCTPKTDIDNLAHRKFPTVVSRIHRSFPVGISVAPDLIGSGSE